MGLLDQYFDPETLAQLKQLNQPSAEDRATAKSNALMNAGFAMMMNNGGQNSQQALFNALGAGGMAGMGAYQGSLDESRKNQSQNLQQAMMLSKMKKDADTQSMISSGLSGILGGQPQFESRLSGVTLDPSMRNNTRLDMSNGESDRDKYAAFVSSFEENMAKGMKPTADQVAAYNEIKSRVQPVFSQVENPRDISGGLRQLGTMLIGSSPEVGKGFLQAADSYRPDYAQVDTGNGIQFVDKRGSVPSFIPKGMSPDSVASNKIAMERLGLDASKFGLDERQFSHVLEKDNGPQWDAGSGQFIIKPNADNPTGKAVTPQGGVGKPLTEVQGKAYGFANRMAAAEKILSDPSTIESPSAIEGIAGSIPFVGGYAANVARPAARQRQVQAEDNWISANLRLESGAVIGKEEMELERRKYFPQIGDSPEVIAQKSEARRVAQQSVAKQAGSSYEQQDMPKARSKQFKLDDGKSVIGTIGPDGGYYVTRGGKKYRIEE